MYGSVGFRKTCSWSDDSTTLVSASYDHTVKLWDVEKSQLVTSSEVPGLVQCVSFNMADNNQYFFGTSKSCIHQVDSRAEVVRCDFCRLVHGRRGMD